MPCFFVRVLGREGAGGFWQKTLSVEGGCKARG